MLSQHSTTDRDQRSASGVNITLQYTTERPLKLLGEVVCTHNCIRVTHIGLQWSTSDFLQPPTRPKANSTSAVSIVLHFTQTRLVQKLLIFEVDAARADELFDVLSFAFQKPPSESCTIALRDCSSAKRIVFDESDDDQPTKRQRDTNVYEERVSVTHGHTTRLSIGEPSSSWVLHFDVSSMRLCYLGSFAAWNHATYTITPLDFELKTGASGTITNRKQHTWKVIPFESTDDEMNMTVRIVEHYGYCRPVKVERDTSASFAQAGLLTDAVLVVGTHTVHVNKNYLATHSKYFELLFFGEFAERDSSDAIVLKDIDYDTFLEFLRVIYPERKALTHRNVACVLSMARYFDCAALLRECTQFLFDDRKLSMFERLHLADAYGLEELVNSWMDSMSESVLISACKYGSGLYSDQLKLRLFDKLGQMRS